MSYKINDLFSDKKLKEFGQDYIKLLAIFLRKAKKISTGALLNSLNSKVQKEAKEIKIIIESNDYLEFIDKGRKPGSFPPIKEISKWVKTKGISEKAAFPIAKSIYKYGIKPTNIINQTVKEITGPVFIRKYENEVSDNLEKIIKKIIEE